MLVSYRTQFSYTKQCGKAFSLPYPFFDCSQISKPTDLPYHPLECQTIHQYPWTLKTSVDIYEVRDKTEEEALTSVHVRNVLFHTSVCSTFLQN